MLNLRVWIDGREIDIGSHKMLMDLMEPEIRIPDEFQGKKTELVLCCDTGYSQYASDGNGGGGFYGRPMILIGQDVSGIEHAEYRDGNVLVNAGGDEYKVEHKLM